MTKKTSTSTFICIAGCWTACIYRIAFGPHAGQVVLKFKTAWRDGTTHLVMSPLEFMQRLAALVPPPPTHRHLS